MWRLIILATAVLVTVISFSATIKYVADGRLDALSALKFMMLAVLPMLQYALPFAAGFGTTLAYHRMAQDNELVASHAGGVSHRALLVPGMISGLILAGSVSLLSEQVIPRFLGTMEQLISKDAARMIVASVQRGEAISFGNVLVHADSVKELGPDAASGASDRLLLNHIAAITLNDDADVQTELTANRAWVYLFPGVSRAGGGGGEFSDQERSTFVLMRIENIVYKMDNKSGTQAVMDFEQDIDAGVRDDPKFLTWSELRALRKTPEQMSWVEQRRRNLAAHMAHRPTINAILESLKTTGRATLVSDDGAEVTFEGRWMAWRPSAGRWEVLRRDGQERVIVDVQRDGRVTRHQAQLARLRIRQVSRKGDRDMHLELELEEVLTSLPGVSGDAANEQRRVSLRKLRLRDDPLESLRQMGSYELIDLAEKRRVDPTRNEEFLAGPIHELESRVEDLQREITSKQHERMAMSVNCFVMILAGAVIAMHLRNSLPLIVYLGSFFPALLTVITISAGQQMTHDNGLVGLILLWGGVVGMFIYTGVLYFVLSRH